MRLIVFKNFDLFYSVYRLGFKSITTVGKVCDAFPELDMVNHTKRAKLVSQKEQWLFTSLFTLE
jgi:hypothetical protein